MVKRLVGLSLVFVFITSCAMTERFFYRNQIVIATGPVPVYTGYPAVYGNESQQPAFFLQKWQIAQVIAFSSKSYPISTIRLNDGREGKIECGNYIVVDTEKI